MIIIMIMIIIIIIIMIMIIFEDELWFRGLSKNISHPENISDELRLRGTNQPPHGRGRDVQRWRGEVHHGYALPLRGPVRRFHDFPQTQPRLQATAGPAALLEPPKAEWSTSEDYNMLLLQLSNAIKNQLKAPKAPE